MYLFSSHLVPNVLKKTKKQKKKPAPPRLQTASASRDDRLMKRLQSRPAGRFSAHAAQGGVGEAEEEGGSG